MFLKILQENQKEGINTANALQLLEKLNDYSQDIRQQLDILLDVRLVRTFFNLLAIILLFRERRMGLLLSELGGYLCGHAHAPAGTKRISNLLRSDKWGSYFIDDYLFNRSCQRISGLLAKGRRPLLLWDDSQVEKHESWMSEGLCSVWSSKAKRLTQMRPGYYRPPKERICVPGFKWTGVFLSCLGSSPSVCQMSWWTSRGKYKEDPDNITWRLLDKVHKSKLKGVLHVFDRGYANEKMLRYLLHFEQEFLIRWKKNVYLNYQGEPLKIDKISRKAKPKASRVVRDKQRKKTKRINIAWAGVSHPEHPDKALTLIILRDSKYKGKGPMYLLTSLSINTVPEAFEMLFTYMHRWESEQGFRFFKTELAIESPRLWFWENRLKLMAIVSLVYDFLLQTLRRNKEWVQLLLKTYCHRTGERYRSASIPLYRLRMAISICLTFLWAQSSG